MNKSKTVDDILRAYKFEINDELSIMDNDKTIWVIIGLMKSRYYLVTIEFINRANHKVHHKIHHKEHDEMFIELGEEPLSIEMYEGIRAIIIETKPDIYSIFSIKGVVILRNIHYEIVTEYINTMQNELL